jgi:hypothetical protein
MRRDSLDQVQIPPMDHLRLLLPRNRAGVLGAVRQAGRSDELQQRGLGRRMRLTPGTRKLTGSGRRAAQDRSGDTHGSRSAFSGRALGDRRSHPTAERACDADRAGLRTCAWP